ncbi:MAG: hypothetical protein Kow00108_07740 [Calditrichia bacterium]
MEKSKNIASQYFLGRQFLIDINLFDEIQSEISQQLKTISHENVFEWLSLNIYEDLLSIIQSFIRNEIKLKYDSLDPSQSPDQLKNYFNMVQFEVLKKCISSPKYQIQSLNHQTKLRLMPFRITSWNKLMKLINTELELDLIHLKSNYDIFQHQKNAEIIIYEELVTFDIVDRFAQSFENYFHRHAYNILKYIQAIKIVHSFWKDELQKILTPIITELYTIQNKKIKSVLNYFVDDIEVSVIKHIIKFREKGQNSNFARRKLLEFFENEKYKNLIYSVVYQSIKNIYLSSFSSKFPKVN